MEVSSIKLDLNQKTSGRRLLYDGEIPGTRMYHLVLGAGREFVSEKDPMLLRVFFLVEGDATFCAQDQTHRFRERAVYLPMPEQELTILASEDTCLMELHWKLNPEDAEFLKKSGVTFPFTRIYSECPQYHEDVKSDKSVSRTILDHHQMPRIAMGSNQSYGPDQVGIHTHPLLDQYFFSFPENKVNLIINGEIVPFGGDTVLHIPLGSYHGVDVPADGQMHYIWIDFMADPKAIAFLDSIHTPTDEMKSL